MKKKSDLLFEWIFNKMNFLVPGQYVEDILKNIVNPIRERTGKSEISEEEFLNLFEGRLGPRSVVKRIFRSGKSLHNNFLNNMTNNFILQLVLEQI